MTKIMDALPSEKHVHPKCNYNFKGFTDPLKLIQISLSKKEASVYPEYLVALNFISEINLKPLKKRKPVLRIKVKTQTIH